MTRDELIAALEAATGPSRELDGAIAKSVGWAAQRNNWWPPEEAAKARRQKRSLWSCDRGPLPLPDYTSSIDAALSLVPEGYQIDSMGEWAHQMLRAAGPWFVILMPRGNLPPPERDREARRHDHAPNAAIALCIAALKARS